MSAVLPTHACNLQLAKFCYCSSGATEGDAFRPGVRWGPWSRSQNGSHMWELLFLPPTWILRWWLVSFCRNIRLTPFFSNTRIILPRTECFLKLCLIGYIWKSYGNKSLIFQFPLKFPLECHPLECLVQYDNDLNNAVWWLVWMVNFTDSLKLFG